MTDDFTTISNQVHSYIFLLGLGLVMLLEVRLAVKQIDTVVKLNRWFANACLLLFGLVFLQLVFPFIGIAAAAWASKNNYGLFNHIEAHPLIVFVTFILATDLLTYSLHRLYHNVGGLWRVHKVHHCDRHVDFSTSVRFHPIEVAFASSAMTFVVFCLGPSMAAILVYLLIHAFINSFSHANFYLTDAISRKVEWVFVTPNLHAVHHCEQRNMADSNYGTLFTFWDRLFCTLQVCQVKHLTGLKSGVKNIDEVASHNLLLLMMLPFKRDTKLATSTKPTPPLNES